MADALGGHVGDDGLSQKLTDATEKALSIGPDLQPSYGKKPGTLIVYVPTNVTFLRYPAKATSRIT